MRESVCAQERERGCARVKVRGKRNTKKRAKERTHISPTRAASNSPKNPDGDGERPADMYIGRMQQRSETKRQMWKDRRFDENGVERDMRKTLEGERERAGESKIVRERERERERERRREFERVGESRRERLSGTAVEQSGLSVSNPLFCCQPLMTDPCRFGAACWRPLCPFVHACSRTRARWWAELWSLLACQKEYEEHVVNVPVPRIHEEIVDAVQIKPRADPQERFWSRSFPRSSVPSASWSRLTNSPCRKSRRKF